MTSRQTIHFPNARGDLLAGSLTLPDSEPSGFVLFAHCFTCGKDAAAAARIARALGAHGFGVLRFDFTGLGGSEGDFANAGFSANVEDLVRAADYLRQQHRAPVLMVGHSLGGTAVLAAAERVPETEAIVTIGAPASPAHLAPLFAESRAEIERSGVATVDIAGRPFPISRTFLDDLEEHPLLDRIGHLRRALLVFHAPLDDVVGIDEASRIFGAARHPKSFISLDGADHLLTRAADAQYVADTLVAWASRYLPALPRDVRSQVASGEVQVAELDGRFLQQVSSDSHFWLADEPTAVGGSNLGPDPYEHLLAALGTCTAMTLRMYASRKKLPLQKVSVRVTHSREHAKDCEDCDKPSARVEFLRRYITLTGDLSTEQRERLLEIAGRCPVHRTLEGDLRIETREAP